MIKVYVFKHNLTGEVRFLAAGEYAGVPPHPELNAYPWQLLGLVGLDQLEPA